jgi:SecD/SecF fusion protein
MVVVLQMSVEDILRRMSNSSNDENFNKAVERTKEKQDQSKDDFVTIFGQEFQQLVPDAKLVAIFATPENFDFIGKNSTNAEVLEVLRERVNATLEITAGTLRSRMDAYGIEVSHLHTDTVTARITLEMKGVDNPAEMRELLQKSGNLEFWETWGISELLPKLSEANTLLAGMPGLTDNRVKQKGANQDSVKFVRENPLFSVLIPPINGGQYAHTPYDAIMGYARPENRATVDKYLAYEEVRALFPGNPKFLWGARINEEGLYPLYAIKTRAGSDYAPLEGDAIRDAFHDIERKSGIEQVVVSMTMTKEGARKWRAITRNNSPMATGNEFGRCIAIVMDSLVYIAPQVNTEIADGRCIISGNFDVVEAKKLASIIKAGKLATPVRIIEEEIR